MPLPAALPIIGAGLSILGGAADIVGGIGANKRQQRFATQMYNRQRADALTDWQRQVAYDSPAAQMARLRDANLNPNLAYGNSVLQSSPTVRSSSQGSINPRIPDFGAPGRAIGAGLQQIYDLKLKEAQTNNIAANTAVAMQDRLLREAQTHAASLSMGKTQTEIDEAKLRLSRGQELLDASVDAAQLHNVNKKLDMDLSIQKNDREILQNSASLMEAAERILTMRANRAKTADERKEILQRIELMKKDGRLKQLDINLKEVGIQPGDPAWMRAGIQLINTPAKPFYNRKTVGEKAAGWLKNPLEFLGLPKN